MNIFKNLLGKFAEDRTIKEKARILAKSISNRSTIKNPNSKGFSNSGDRAAQIVANTLQEFGVCLDSGASILDFGAGSGRVALPLMNLHPELKLTAMDVDAESIEYLSLQAPDSCSAIVSSYEPPIQCEDQIFDAMYAISVWSHFPEDLGRRWLEEMHRITRPGAIMLISVGGRTTLLNSDKKPWTDISLDAFEREKFVYKEYVNLHNNQKHYPGIAGQGSWGVTAIHPDYIRSKWAEVFEVLEIREAGTPGTQDLVVLRRK